MRRYLAAARRYRWMIPVILAVVWGAGIFSAYREYTTTFESAATIWVLRPSPELTNINPEDPGTPVIQTVATQQTELISQLLQSDSFIRDVVQRTPHRAALEAAPNEARYLDGVRKRFDVETLGTNMLRLSFTSNDPRTPVEMVKAALDVRTERVLNARVTSTAAVGTLYRREFEVAQAQALDATKELDAFRAGHTGELGASDAAHQAQLQLAVDFAQSRLSELRGRADRAAVMSAMVAIAAGVLLVSLLVLAGAFLADHLEGPLDIGRLAPARLFATVPRVAATNGQSGDVRASLAAIAFARANTKS